MLSCSVDMEQEVHVIAVFERREHPILLVFTTTVQHFTCIVKNWLYFWEMKKTN